MEEQILKIIEKNLVTYHGEIIGQGIMDTSKEITSHIMEFIEWITGNDHWPVTWTGNGIFRIKQYPIVESWEERSIEEVYQFWLTNIKK